ncbi:phage holin family protein [Patescibacteria group bacterium]
MNLILRWLLSTITIMLAAYLITGVGVSGFWTALWLALFLGLLNAVIKPILIVITLPINIITLGLFTFVINALIILIASSVIKGFEVDGFWVAMLFSIVVSVISWALNSILGTKNS